jgi:Cu(I)/Ag(I) efflux system membrane fusion protein
VHSVKTRVALLAGVTFLALAGVGGFLMTRPRPAPAPRVVRQVWYRCPMHPSVISDHPGECSICGMDLERVPDSEMNGAGASAAGESAPGADSLGIFPERIQLIGVRTAVVERRALGGALDRVGLVGPDETRIERVQLRAAGWVRQLFVSSVGEEVTLRQPLLSLYSPDLYQSEQEYLIANGGRSAETGKDAPEGMDHSAPAAGASRTRLELLGVPPEEIRRLQKERTAQSVLTLRSPVAGTVLERGVTSGQYVGAETPLFTIADLSRVWVLADLDPMDVGHVRIGDRAAFTSDALPGRTFSGRLEFLYPTVSSATRTLKARVSLANYDGALRPGMYGRVRIAGRGTSGLAVPSEAVLNTGENPYVFVAHPGGRFEPRVVSTGLRDGAWIQVLGGVSAGDTVVASASFLIDSESRLKGALQGSATPGGSRAH